MQYLQSSDLGTAYQDAQTTARKSWKKYDELERLAANEVRGDLPANMPRVNDGSLSATIKKIPKRIMAKPMTGSIKALDRDEDWIAQLVSIIWEKRIIPNATTDATFLRKWKIAIRNSKTYGSQPIYTFFTQHGTYTGADMSLPYVKNCYLEPGKVSDLASDFTFMDSFYTKLQAKRLLDRAIQLWNEAEEGGFEYEGIWTPKELGMWYDAGPAGKDSENQTINEREGYNRNEKGLYKLVTCFNRGYEAPFYTFAPSISDKVVGTQFNTNPSGDMPLIWLYDDEDLINPYGTGLIHSAGATQNVLDNFTQTDVLMTQVGSQPPVGISGDRTQANLKSFVYSPAAFWFKGNAVVEPQKVVDPSMYNAMPGRFGLYKSQLQFQTGTFDNSVSAESGNPAFSKTSAGVKELANQTNADDNDTQQSIADAYSRVAKSMVNIHMNNMEGTELLKLEGDEIDRLAKTDLIPNDPNTGQPLTSEQIELVWDNLRGNFEFEVDPTSSILEEDRVDADAVRQAINDYLQNPAAAQLVAQSGYKFNLGDLYVQLLQDAGIKNIDKILVKITPEEQSEMEQNAMLAGGVDPNTGQTITETDQGSNHEEQPEMGQDVEQIMQQYNVDAETAAGIAAALDHGVAPEDYLNYVQGGSNG